jgi:hypothetical protein
MALGKGQRAKGKGSHGKGLSLTPLCYASRSVALPVVPRSLPFALTALLLDFRLTVRGLGLLESV